MYKELLNQLTVRLTTLTAMKVAAKESYDQLTGAVRELNELILTIQDSNPSPVEDKNIGV
jgi:hypothetical protein